MADLIVRLTCPACGATADETPLDRCVYFSECPSCHVIVKPKPRDYCVFCSYGHTRCPFVQDSCE